MGRIKGTAATILAALMVIATQASANYMEEPGISIPTCTPDGISMYWHTENGGKAPPPEGWKLERRHQQDGEDVTTPRTFVGPEADALRSVEDRYWDWTDTRTVAGTRYTYRVRAINEDKTYMAGRAWSRRAEVICEKQENPTPTPKPDTDAQTRADAHT